MTLDNVHKRLLDNLKTGVMLLDSNLHLRYINLAAEHLLGMSDRKANQLFVGEVFIEATQDIEEMRAALVNDHAFTKHNAEFQLSNRKTITVDYTINPFEEGGEIQAVLELNSIEHSKRVSREESISSARATTQELVRGLAHEIKNPLGGIRGAAQLLAQELPDPELADYTNVIIGEADRLRNLVDRLVGSRKPLALKEINIHEVLERVRSLVAAEINDKAIELELDYDPSIPKIKADPEQLIQAMLNLVRNAMQSLDSPDVAHDLGKILLRTRVLRNATVRSEFHRLAASIEVVDNGPGIVPKLMNSMFYPMISGRAEGTGLGLSITHAIVSHHQGMIECDSKPGHTCFSVVLPILDS
ncbi:MAG: nitrogen regulation protein NR(II) [Gammaproteobacteria bacterium]|nr:nitrogen regulation protein NR(II) [Gammaproteobacteria bacterium]MDP6097179.1 nitrogen regulation protein NR(II) [Gammaproteobacteria bacterium]MDP7455728.1 nitrogen regulation protein NR(II) [Gammaproteobacteria bacterium]